MIDFPIFKTVNIPGELISTGIHFYVFRPHIDNVDRWIPKRYTEYNHSNKTLNIPIHVASKYGLAGQSKIFEVSEGLEWRME